MHITELVWDDENKEHIAQHQVKPEEVEELFFEGAPYIRGFQDVYHAFGQTQAGRYLFVVFRALGKERGRVITAREMNAPEKRFYRKRRGIR